MFAIDAIVNIRDIALEREREKAADDIFTNEECITKTNAQNSRGVRPTHTLDTTAECPSVLRFVSVGRDTDTTRADVRIEPNDETEYQKRRFYDDLLGETLLDIQCRSRAQPTVVVRSFYRSLPDVSRIPNL